MDILQTKTAVPIGVMVKVSFTRAITVRVVFSLS